MKTPRSDKLLESGSFNQSVVLAQRMELALQAVLLFHDAETWDGDKRLVWANITKEILGECREATTKTLCDIVRKVLEVPK